MNSKMRILACVISVIGLLILSFSVASLAAEHPQEHPKKTTAEPPKEHPQAASKEAAAEVTMESLAQAITDYINKDTALRGGYFCVYDPEKKVPLALSLDKVHRDKLAKVSGDLYFACSDFTATDGTTYDLDFFMKATKSGLEVSEITIHKEAGKPRYGWVEEGGVWKRK